jgi:hypothetical protein
MRLLHKSLYGLKQAVGAWRTKQRAEMINHGFTPSKHEPRLFVRGGGSERVHVMLHLDDAIIIRKAGSVKRTKDAIAS